MRASHPAISFRPSVHGARWQVVLLVVVLACVSCAPFSAPSAVNPVATLHAQPPQPLAGSIWEQLALPAFVADVHGFVVAPNDPATLFACTAHLTPTDAMGDIAPQPMTFWRTTDTGAHWTRYTPALATGFGCSFSIAPDDPKRMTLQVSRPEQNAQPCAGNGFYLSDDGGATWHTLLPHISIAPKAAYGWCDLHVTRRHLYLASSYALASQGPQVSLLERSDDDGATWQRADHGLGEDALYLMPAIGPGDMLAMTIYHWPVHPAPAVPGTTELWTSVDAGDTWRRTSQLPGGDPFLLTSGAQSGGTWPSSQHPFYVLEQEQIPSDLYRERVLASADGQHWALLPPLPVSGVSDLRRGILQTLSVLPDGRLALWGTDPRGGVPAIEPSRYTISGFWLWLWNPASQRWQFLPSPLNVTAHEGCGLCWQAQTAVGRDGTTYLYVAYLDALATISPPGLFRVRMP